MFKIIRGVVMNQSIYLQTLRGSPFLNLSVPPDVEHLTTSHDGLPSHSADHREIGEGRHSAYKCVSTQPLSTPLYKRGSGIHVIELADDRIRIDSLECHEESRKEECNPCKHIKDGSCSAVSED